MADNSNNSGNTTTEELKLGEGRKASLGEVAQTALKNVDLVWLGDANHNSRKVRNEALSKENLIKYAEGGATHVFLEIGADGQQGINNTVKNSTSSQTSTDKLIISGKEISSDKVEQFQNMGQLGMEVHCVDPMTEVEKRKLLSHPQGVLAMGSDDKEGIKVQYKRLEMDPTLASNIRKNLPEGEKGIGFYGALHGSRSNDLDENFQGKMIKIDVYESEADINVLKEHRELGDILVEEEMGIKGYKTGNDHPELVYFTDTGTVRTTQNTPDWLKDSLKELGKPAVSSAVDKPSTPSNEAPPPQPVKVVP